MTKTKSKYYYDTERNIDINCKNEINPKMLMTKEQLGLNKTKTGGLHNDSRVPKYYKGKEGYEARKVCDNFDLSYHCGTAVTYILRAYKKHDKPIECLKKAIAHLEFEIDKYDENNKR
tara:strand:+ start:1604 stop:1957 length:354 start_codon:yes stop_codon:yes gene_type:complete